ncbi:phosphatidate cytidylyltransferase [Acinetobacter pollinis]|uniref:phosphatidate cytidylyltransferase n=1 Tax=Acinetobacter pollinis TaxID=2605270 RepID=UPI0018A2CDAD|nr:phosphatidate cytidylyltransferase [Acinetobacter pollinis]MBF7689438.1 CDP-archaeol synthase [Acinetobacter pollinis]MBF7692084.1 CDP-archaeol synthase [Acinetobacter pollinis]MBF7696967.1 CDP-archaeol synthase [Acinetobacter pollinis]MBF7700359.1 CDP-archaeol synthase [Acinetobacter pollinis]
MFERIKTALVLVAVVLSCMFATSSHYPMLALMLVAAGVGGYEWGKLMPRQVQTHHLNFTYIYAFCMVIIASITLYFRDIAFLLWCVSICIWLLSIYCVKNYPKFDGWYNKGLNTVGIVLICSAVTSIYYVWINSPWWLMYLFLLVWGADSGAYFVGRKLGRRKMVPNVSPNKSIEGLIGGLCTSVLIVMVVQLHYLHLSLRDHLLFLSLSIVTVLGSVLGDLFESMIKRRVGVKDSGSILPGHGGVLDRIDSLLAAAPIFAAGVYLLKLIGVDL